MGDAGQVCTFIICQVAAVCPLLVGEFILPFFSQGNRFELSVFVGRRKMVSGNETVLSLDCGCIIIWGW